MRASKQTWILTHGERDAPSVHPARIQPLILNSLTCRHQLTDREMDFCSGAGSMRQGMSNSGPAKSNVSIASLNLAHECVWAHGASGEFSLRQWKLMEATGSSTQAWQTEARKYSWRVWLLIIANLVGKVLAILVGWTAPATALALWFGPDALLAYHIFVPHAQGVVRSARQFATSQREVWLTIDDGPDPEDTHHILELLAAHRAQATFFVIGENVARHTHLVREVVAAGHEVAHHTYTHPLATFWYASPARVGRELDRALTALAGSGVVPTRFRSPAGIKSLWLAPALKARGLTSIGWSARGLERWHQHAEPVASRLLKNLQPGAILLLHEGPRVPAAVRVHAIRLVLERLQKEGYRCVIPEGRHLIY